MIYINHLKLTESSGICRSPTIPGLYYSHNDSGNAPTLYAFDELGENLGEYPLNLRPIDCEAISSGMVNSVPTIILCDVGDNNLARLSYKIHVINEVSGTSGPTFSRSINFTYPDGKRRNCESATLLPDGKIILVTKSYPLASGPTQAFTLLSYLSGDSGTVCFAGPLLHAKLGTITDADYKDGVLVLLGVIKTRPAAHFFNIGDWTPFKSVVLDTAPQAEALCLSHDGKKVLMTSETNRTAGARTPLYVKPLL